MSAKRAHAAPARHFPDFAKDQLREILLGVSSSARSPAPPSPSTAASLPRWLPWLIAAVPVVPFFYLVAFAALGSLRRLPPPARWVLFYFAASQVIAAMFTPNPLLSVCFAGVRTFEILAMIAAGVYLKDSRHLRPLLWGEVVIFLSAWGYSLYTQGPAGILARLSHPYYYTVSLGLLAVIALWLIMFWRGGAVWWRVAVGLLAIATLLAAGSRGPTLALIVGSGAALLLAGRQGMRRWVLLPLGVVAAAIAVVSTLKLNIAPILRLLDDQTSGRNFVWADAYAAWQTSPVGGVGTYQGGPYLTYLFSGGCQLNPILAANHIECPEWLSSFSSMWLIAHNAWLQWLMETGVIGLSGLLLVYGYGLWAAAKSRDPLLIAALFGYTAMNFVDVVIAVPTPHFAELWWVMLGISVWRLEGAAAERTTPVNPRPVDRLPSVSVD